MIGLVAMVVAVAVAGVLGQQYTSQWDNIDVATVLRNERLLKTYFRCVMDQGRCSPAAAELKKNLPVALESDCAKCSGQQRQKVATVVRHIFQKNPEMFKQLEQKYDPQGTYRKRHLGQLKDKEVSA